MGRGEADEKRPGASSYSGKGFSLTVYVLENVSFGELVSLSPNTLQHYEERKWRRPYLIAEMFCLSYCPGSSSGVGNISSAAGG